jgi:hypothetical protein
VRPPVAFGCFLGVAALLLVAVIVGFLVIFLKTGSESGTITLDPAASYGPGTIAAEPAHNLLIVRLADGDFVALADLDAANRASAGRRCRVSPIPANDPSLPGLLQRYQSRFSPAAAGTTTILTESCHGAMYDITGVRLDSDGPNLDRYETGTDSKGNLTVKLGKRTCSQRQGSNPFTRIPCPDASG